MKFRAYRVLIGPNVVNLFDEVVKFQKFRICTFVCSPVGHEDSFIEPRHISGWQESSTRPEKKTSRAGKCNIFAFPPNNVGFSMRPRQIHPAAAHRSVDNTSLEHPLHPLNTTRHNANDCHKSVFYTTSLNGTVATYKVTMQVVHIHCCYSSKHIAFRTASNPKPKLT
jgi:hypothetical protein